MLLDSFCGECAVNRVDKGRVLDHIVVCLIFIAEEVVLFVRQVEAESREDSFELTLCHLSFSQLVEISEKFVDPHSLHDNHRLKSRFDI